jgi:hypothetical protein
LSLSSLLVLLLNLFSLSHYMTRLYFNAFGIVLWKCWLQSKIELFGIVTTISARSCTWPHNCDGDCSKPIDCGLSMLLVRLQVNLFMTLFPNILITPLQSNLICHSKSVFCYIGCDSNLFDLLGHFKASTPLKDFLKFDLTQPIFHKIILKLEWLFSFFKKPIIVNENQNTFKNIHVSDMHRVNWERFKYLGK